MTKPIEALTAAVAAVESAWGSADVSEGDVSRLVAINDALGMLRRTVDAVQAGVAAEVARASRPELGPEGLAKQQGFRTPALLLASTLGATAAEANKLVAVGEAVAPRMTFSGESAPARHPFVAEALAAGRVSVAAAHAIITMLDRVALRCRIDDREDAERTLADSAAGLTLDQLSRVVARAEAYLDPEGVEPREEESRGKRSVVMFQRGGMLHLNAVLDPESGASVVTAIQAIVSAEFRRAGGGDAPGSGAGADPSADPSEGAGVDDGEGAGRDAAGAPADPDEARRTLPQRQADALVMLAMHVLGCDHHDLPLDGATVIVRVSLDDLRSGSGVATIDGIDQPISISTARRMAASGGIIPCVLGAKGEILDWGREKRLFTRAQKLALVERDGGCAMCGLPPGMTKAHHIRWWARDRGPTDLSNGVLLCESCHHRIHDNGWDVRIDGIGAAARVRFIPPRHVDPQQTPRLGGRARFDYAA